MGWDWLVFAVGFFTGTLTAACVLGLLATLSIHNEWSSVEDHRRAMSELEPDPWRVR